MEKFIDITFDFKTATSPGKDPDALNRTLRSYHQFLWSKPLPNGVLFEINGTRDYFAYPTQIVVQNTARRTKIRMIDILSLLILIQYRLARASKFMTRLCY